MTNSIQRSGSNKQWLENKAVMGMFALLKLLPYRHRNWLMGATLGSFLGNIIVDDDAINVKAHLVNKNLLLSDKASAISEPQLDINTKEIECTHGCTISNIDKDDLYYLNSKGIDNFEATEILKEAFLK